MKWVISLDDGSVNYWAELDLNQLADKLRNHFHFDRGFDCLRFENELKTHMDVEEKVERLLRVEGYTPATINRTRTQIRDLLLYTSRGHPVKEHILEGYLSEMSTDFRTSTPFKLLIRARKNHDLNLYKPGELFYSLYE